MATNDRAAAVVDFPSHELDDVVTRLKRSLGKVSSHISHTALHANPALSVPAGATIDLVGSRWAFDSADAGVDSVRLSLRGSTTGGAITVQLYDYTTSTVLATVTLPNATTTTPGAWTALKQWSGDHDLGLRLVGDSTHTQSLESVIVQWRTVSFN